MKNLVSSLLVFAFVNNALYSQSPISNANTTPIQPSVVFAKKDAVFKSSDCIGLWVSNEGYSLLLSSNDKAVRTDEGHIYYMTWHSEDKIKEDTIAVNLSGTERCTHRHFYLVRTYAGIQIIENRNNPIQTHPTKQNNASALLSEYPF